MEYGCKAAVGGDFSSSETDSRAELQYPDGTVVRVGQNTVFTFDSCTRTLMLDRVSLLLFLYPENSGGTIKTASLTAAITGTAGKVSDNVIAIVEGEVKLVPSGRIVHAGEFARRNADGSITIAAFDKTKVLEGKLVRFNGLMPGFPEELLVEGAPSTFSPQRCAIWRGLYKARKPAGRRNLLPGHHISPKKDKGGGGAGNDGLPTLAALTHRTRIKVTSLPRGLMRQSLARRRDCLLKTSRE